MPGRREQGRATNRGVQGTHGRLGPSGPAHRATVAADPLGAPCPRGGSEDRLAGLRAHPVRLVPLPLPAPSSLRPPHHLSESPGHTPPLSTGALPLGASQSLVR